MNIADYISLGAVFVAVSALVWQVRQSTEQSKMQTFLTFTQRYQDIVINMPIGIEAENFSIELFDDSRQEEILRWLRAYFDLSSEEYYLNKKKLIHKKVWELWEAGMIDSLKKPAFVSAWEKIQSNKYFDEEFSGYIEGIIEQHKNA